MSAIAVKALALLTLYLEPQLAHLCTRPLPTKASEMGSAALQFGQLAMRL